MTIGSPSTESPTDLLDRPRQGNAQHSRITKSVASQMGCVHGIHRVPVVILVVFDKVDQVRAVINNIPYGGTLLTGRDRCNTIAKRRLHRIKVEEIWHHLENDIGILQTKVIGVNASETGPRFPESPIFGFKARKDMEPDVVVESIRFVGFAVF